VIFGVFDREPGARPAHDVRRVAETVSPGRAAAVWTDARVALCSLAAPGAGPTHASRVYMNEASTIALVAAGELYNLAEVEQALGLSGEREKGRFGQALIRLYERNPAGWLDGVNGKFAFALWDASIGRLLLGRDRLGIEPIFYAEVGSRLLFSSALTPLLAAGWFRRRLDLQALLQYLLYSYNPGDSTLVSGVRRLPAGSLLSIDGAGPSIRRYWRLSFADVQAKREEERHEEVLALFRDAIRIRLDEGRKPGVLLSGGTDSSAIVSLTAGMVEGPFRTFSFRCEGRSYDESGYARFVAERFGTEHTEIPYRPDALFLISTAVEAMDEPFCDAGIEMGTYLLGQTAAGNAAYVLSGEGGDELFAGHPVYVADKMAVIADLFPGPVVRPLARALQRIPDSDQKKNLQVKLKRFAYSLAFPRELLGHRWRVYYTPNELRALCSRDFLAECDLERMFEPILKYNAEADGKDRLSRSLYSDFYTLVSFYLRRLGLLRAFGVESRTPLLDHRLIEYSTHIPSGLKIRGLSDTKYVYRRILEGVVPREILHGRPKLGHSVPMKNWLREDRSLKEWFHDTLTSSSFRDRGLFNPLCVQRLLDEHANRSHNHIHRLWALMVLETWLGKHWDGVAN
jgi:asparagine synthase (glutamine-hydrolysing)